MCFTLETDYSDTLQQAKSCDPASLFEQCSTLVNNSLYCGCPTYVNMNQIAAVDTLFNIEERFYSSGCSADVICGDCALPSRAHCSMAGLCYDVY
jgi:hypothetical protein